MREDKIVNVVICYNNGNEVVKYIDSMKTHKHIDEVCFVITMNSWSEDDKQIINEYMTDTTISVILFYPENNLGYMNGLIQGYRFYRKTHDIPLFVVMSNTDISIPNSEYYEELLNKEYDANVGCIGPSVYVKEKDTYDNPVCEHRRTLAEIDKIMRIFSNRWVGGLYYYLSTRKGYFVKKRKTDSRYVYEVHGCYFILTGEFAEIVKLLEYGVLLYSEEAYVAELIFKHGMKVFYDASLEVVHLEHGTTKFVKCSKIAKYIHESMAYIKSVFY